MSRLAKTFIFVASLSALTLTVFPAAAQLNKIDNAGELGIAPGNDPKPIIFNIINVGLGLVALAAAVYIIFAGIRYISSQGDETASEKAKKGIFYAVIGLVVIGLAALIVNFTIGSFGGGGGRGAGGGGGFE